MLSIDKYKISKKSKTYIIAEIAQSHLGNFKKIKNIIDHIAKTGVEFIKFQTHYANEESTLQEPFRKKIKNFKNRIDYWKKMEFSNSQWRDVKRYCEKKNLVFLSSPFSERAVNMLKELNIAAWKIGSGEFFSDNLINKILATKKPIILSTGLSTLKEVKEKTKYLKRKNNSLILMQCTSLYPCNFKDVGINILDTYKNDLKCFYGLSDHSGSIYPSIFAMAKDASLIEVHVSIEKNLNNPDLQSSISIKELVELVKARDAIYEMKKNRITKSKLTRKLKLTKKIFTKSCSLKKSKKKGDIIKKNDITFKKPGTGVPEKKAFLFYDKKLNKDLNQNVLLSLNDINK